MKNIKVLFATLLVGSLVFTSCGDDDDDAIIAPVDLGPTAFTIDPDTIDGLIGEAVTFDYYVETNGDSLVAMYVTVDSDPATTDTVTLGAQIEVGNYVWSIPDTANVNDMYTLNFTAIDVDGIANALFETAVVRVNGTPLVQISGSDGDTIYNVVGAAQGSFDLVNNMRISSTAANNGISDMRNASNSAGFVGDWNSLTASAYFRVEETMGFDYDDATLENTSAIYEGKVANGEIPMTNVGNVMAGDIFIAKLRDDSYAAMVIAEILPTEIPPQGGVPGAMVFFYKK